MVKKSILIDGRYFGKSGIGRYLEEMLIALDIVDLEITFLGEKDKIQHFFTRKASFIEFPYPTLSISEQLGYTRIRKKYDIYWSPHITVPIWKKLAKKNICTLHDITPLIEKRGFLKKIYFFFMLVNCKLKKYVIVFDTNYVQKQLKFMRFENRVVIPLAPKSIFFNLAAGEYKSKNFAKRKYVLCVGNLKPHKNLQLVINAWNNSSALSSKYDLKIVGASDLRSNNTLELEKSSALNTSIEITGKVSDDELAKLYANASMFVMPSFSEGFGLPVLEAQAAGLKVICSNATCLPETGGDGCIYFDPHDIDSLTSAVLKAEHDKELLQRAKLNVGMYSWKASSKLLKQLFLDDY